MGAINRAPTKKRLGANCQMVKTCQAVAEALTSVQVAFAGVAEAIRKKVSAYEVVLDTFRN